MFFEDEKENTGNNNSDMQINDNESWDILDDNDNDDDLISIKDTSDKVKEVYDDSDEIGGLSSLDLDDELKLIDDDDLISGNSSDNIDDVDDVDDDELARILNENGSPAKQKAFDAFGSGNDDIVNQDDIIEEEFDMDDELQGISNDIQEDSYSSQEQNSYEQDYSSQPQNLSSSSEEYDDDINYQPQPQQKQQTSPLLLAVLFAVLVAAGVYFILGYTKDKGLDQNELPVAQNYQQEEINQNLNTQEVQENIPVVNEEEVDTIKPDVPEKKEVVNVQSTGKINPFVPIQKYVAFEAPKAYYNYDASGIPKPPSDYGERDEAATKLMSISVSGIMYDENKPSAIISLDDNDYFVQKGDKLDDYRVVEITRNDVKIALGKNIYKANLGEEFKLNSFYGNVEYLPQGRQYHVVSEEIKNSTTSTHSSSRTSSTRYTSEKDVQVNAYYK